MVLNVGNNSYQIKPRHTICRSRYDAHIQDLEAQLDTDAGEAHTLKLSSLRAQLDEANRK